jgi:hypothetical protein
MASFFAFALAAGESFFIARTDVTLPTSSGPSARCGTVKEDVEAHIFVHPQGRAKVRLNTIPPLIVSRCHRREECHCRRPRLIVGHRSHQQVGWVGVAVKSLPPGEVCVSLCLMGQVVLQVCF